MFTRRSALSILIVLVGFFSVSVCAQETVIPLEGLDPVMLSQGKEVQGDVRSEERRVGKECRSRWSPYH